MKLKAFALGLVLMAGLISQAADPMNSVETIAPGVWCSKYTEAKAYAEKNGMPVLMFWANPGCHMCEMMEEACRTAEFKAWQASRQLVMVFSYGTAGDGRDCKKFVKNSSGKYPYMCVYWQSNTSGQKVYERFSGVSGEIGHGTTKRQELWEQLANAVDNILPDWVPGGEPQPEPCTHAWDAGKVTKNPTCELPGEKTFTCTKCQETKTEKINALGHHYVEDVCERCGANNPSYKPEPCNHAWDEGKVTKEPTCTASGVKTFTCGQCQETKTEKINALGHHYVDGVCERCGAVDPETERKPIDPKAVFKSAKTFPALVTDGSEPVGTAKVTLGKISAVKRTVKVGISLSLFTGKTVTKSLSLVPDEFGGLSGLFKFAAPVGAMEVAISYDQDEKTFGIEAGNEEYTVEIGEYQLGGYLDTEELSFSADLGEAELPDNYEFVVDAPSGETVYVKSGSRFAFDKAASIKYKKIKEDGETWYELIGLDDEKRPNVTGLKLTYAKATGKFSGSFKVYASNEFATEGKPTLKAYTVKVSGVIVDGAGYGTTSVKIGRKTYRGTCSLD